MASKYEYTVKIPCATQNPWMSYNEVLEFILTHPPDSLIVNYSDIDYYSKVLQALQWEQNRILLQRDILSLNMCDVVEDMDFSML